LHGFGQAEFERVADEGVADRDLADARHADEKIGQVEQVQVVPGIDLQAGANGRLGGAPIALQARGLPGPAVGARIGFGVELDPIGAELARRCHRLGLGVHEEAHARADLVRLRR
jgi:hypothetical protein